MKKAIVFLAAGLLLLACLPAFSQEKNYPKDAYSKTVPIAKIWLHPLGYKVIFLKGDADVGEIYLPLNWFGNGPSSKADLTYGNDPGYPYFSIFWADGKFDHISLHVMASFTHPTWGEIEAVNDMKGKFDVKEIPLEF